MTNTPRHSSSLFSKFHVSDEFWLSLGVAGGCLVVGTIVRLINASSFGNATLDGLVFVAGLYLLFGLAGLFEPQPEAAASKHKEPADKAQAATILDGVAASVSPIGDRQVRPVHRHLTKQRAKRADKLTN